MKVLEIPYGEELKEEPEDRLKNHVNLIQNLARSGSLVYIPPVEEPKVKEVIQEEIRPAVQFLTYPNGGSLAKTVIQHNAEEGIKEIQTLIDMTYWYSCQMEAKTIFQVNSILTICRLLELTDEGDDFSERVLADYPSPARVNTSMCNSGTNYAFLIGGRDGGNYLKSCLRYNMTTNEWDQMPQMKVAR